MTPEIQEELIQPAIPLLASASGSGECCKLCNGSAVGRSQLMQAYLVYRACAQELERAIKRQTDKIRRDGTETNEHH